jgi:hypothetical protein
VSVIATSFGRSRQWGDVTATRLAARDRALTIASIAASAFLLAHLLDFGYGRDQGIFAAVAAAIRDGGVPYRDAWDFKPPGIYMIYTLAGPWALGIRLLEAASLVSLTIAFALLSQRYMDDWRPGIVGAALAIFTHVQLEFWHTAQPESFGAAVLAWAMVAAAGSPMSDRWRSSREVWWRSMMLGACVSFGLLLKPMIGAAGAASFLVAIGERARAERQSIRRAVPAVAGPFCLGAAIPLAPCVLLFAVRGGAAEMQHALGEFAPHYMSLAWQQTDITRLTAGLLSGWLFDYSLINVVGLLLLIVPFPTNRTRDGLVHAGLVIAILLGGILAQGRLFPYHFGAVLPLTSLLAGWGYWRLWSVVRTRWFGMLAFAAMLVMLAMLRPASPDLPDTFAERCRLRLRAWTHADERAAIRDRLYSVVDYRAGDNRAAAEWIARETAPGATVFVYGFTPEIYVASRRRAASRYIYDVPQRAPWSQDRARRELIAELNAAPPEIVVVEHLDVMPWVLGTTTDSAQDVATFSGLRDLIASRYARTTGIGKFDLYRRIE